MPNAPLTEVPQESPPASPVVEVFAPPHLRHIADEIARCVREQIDQLPADVLHRLARAGAEIERQREEFERFRRRIGIK